MYLAWFSSLTHLSCLTLLRNHLYQRPAERTWRLMCMFILVVLLILAFLPTANYGWQYGNSTEADRPGPQDYAVCYLKPSQRTSASYVSPSDHIPSDRAIIAMSISVILVFVGLLCRLFKLHQSLSSFVSETIRGRISHMLRTLLRAVHDWSDIVSGFPRSLKRLLVYRPFLALFLTARILVDTWDSMFFEVSPLMSRKSCRFLRKYRFGGSLSVSFGVLIVYSM